MVTRTQWKQINDNPLACAALDWAAGQAVTKYQEYSYNPTGFCTDVLRTQLTDGQIKILNSVRDYRTTVVRSANGTGKTFCGGAIAHWFFHCLPQSKVILAAAPPLDNLKRLLWGAIEAQSLKNPQVMQGVHDRVLYYSYGPEWWLEGRAIPVGGSPEEIQAKFSGVHAPFLLFIIDEGDAVREEVYRGVEACLTGGLGRLLVFFNPRYQGGPVQKLIDEGANIVELDAFSHPNVTSGEVQIPGAVDRPITVQRIATWSRRQADDEQFSPDDPMWFRVPDFLDGASVTLSSGEETTPLVGGEWRRVKDEHPEMCHIVLARYPGQSLFQLIPREWVVRAQNLWLLRREWSGDNPPEGIRPISGLDVADYGSDPNSLCHRYELWVAPFHKINGMKPDRIAKWAAQECHDVGTDVCRIDDLGVGSGVAGNMRDWWASPETHPDCEYYHRAEDVRVSHRATDDLCYSLRDQMYWAVREFLQHPGAMLPPSEALLQQCVSIRYRYDSKGLIRVTPKEELKERLRRSPDEFESLGLTLVEGQDNRVFLGWA